MTYIVFLGMMIPLAFLILLLKGENRMIMLFFILGIVAFVLSLTVNGIRSAHFKLNVSHI